jgi:DNA-binding MarR family transcriptional regulator
MPTDLPLFFDELVRFQIELWDAVDARLAADCDLSLVRFLPLRVIAGRAGCRVQDIADELAVTVGGISKGIDRLVAAGLCVRSANPDDRRSSLIALTPAGEQALAAGNAAFADELRKRVGSVLPDATIQDLTKTLTALRTAIHSAAVAPVPAPSSGMSSMPAANKRVPS